jgi:hypothetical protein
MDGRLPRPDRDRLSTLTALILLTNTLIRIVALPVFEAKFAILGLLIRFEVNASLIMISLAAALAAAGADWLIHSHPKSTTTKIQPEHWVIPGLAAAATGAVLTRIPDGPGLWIGIVLTALLLLAVVMAEFVVVDPKDPRFDVASVGLSALAYLLLIGVLFAILASDLRAVFSVPLILLVSFVVIWRLLHLNQLSDRAAEYALLISLLNAQLAWALHYWPLPPLRGALLLGILVYLTNGLTLLHRKKGLVRGRIIEFAALFAIAVTAIFTFT